MYCIPLWLQKLFQSHTPRTQWQTVIWKIHMIFVESTLPLHPLCYILDSPHYMAWEARSATRVSLQIWFLFSLTFRSSFLGKRYESSCSVTWYNSDHIQKGNRCKSVIIGITENEETCAVFGGFESIPYKSTEQGQQINLKIYGCDKCEFGAVWLWIHEDLNH